MKCTAEYKTYKTITLELSEGEVSNIIGSIDLAESVSESRYPWLRDLRGVLLEAFREEPF